MFVLPHHKLTKLVIILTTLTIIQEGTPNEEVEVIETDTFCIPAENSEPSVSCCTFCASKELIRAVLTNDQTLLKNCLQSRHVYALTVPRSADVLLNALDYAILTNNHAMV